MIGFSESLNGEAGGGLWADAEEAAGRGEHPFLDGPRASQRYGNNPQSFFHLHFAQQDCN